MSTSEIDRHHLYEVARERWDDDAAQTLMSLLPPDPDRLATKDDLAATTATLRTEMAELRRDLRTEMADLRGELRSDMAELGAGLRTEMTDLRGGLRSEMADRFAEQTRTLMLAMVGMWLSVAALVVGLRFS